ncbi:MAG: hypothetical protein ACTS43_00020 [Candidatus Hodgkinia cicadicola]
MKLSYLRIDLQWLKWCLESGMQIETDLTKSLKLICGRRLNKR